MNTELDHIVIAADTLRNGINYIEKRFGITPEAGGQHLSMGTHNALLSLGASCYLEVIAIDPDLPQPPRPRWFGLDDNTTREQLRAEPRLIHWVARSNDIDALSRQQPQLLGPAIPMERNQFKWLITVPENGSLPFQGAVPSLIQWQTRPLPSELLVDRGLRLKQLTITTPVPDRVLGTLSQLKLTNDNVSVIEGRKTVLSAEISDASSNIIQLKSPI